MHFLKRTPHVHDRHVQARFLSIEADPVLENTTSILPLNELRERLERIGRVENYFDAMHGDWELDRYQFAGLLFMPIATLRRLSATPQDYDAEVRLDSNGELIRNAALASERKELDKGKCVVLGIADPEACHIIPFSSCRTKGKLDMFRLSLGISIALLLEDDAEVQNLECFTSRVGASDELWNMISLSPHLHVWWRRAYFGFKFLGILPSDEEDKSLIRVQFHWMPKSIAWRRGQRDEHDLGIKLTNDRSPLFDHGVTALRHTGRPLTAGDTFDIPVATVDAPKMVLAFQIQWAVIRIASAAGAAGVDTLGADVETLGAGDDGPPPDEGFLTRRDIERWMDNTRQPRLRGLNRQS
ncbi:hypothetical protein B0T24DRAFT_540049 [Lasiosphaeria ovina]|uniref:HNH nuclease domain-containing protein n=1 Tax=Lasiosphaeria ovina TaxID=92902 RepID=A0AAE0MYA0_9PEZI|nr:hypothetical protein B0T24DRAFT_540049 [Lasiosphaeria ovina]